MIAMKFTIELDIGLSFPSAGCSATASDRSRDENSSSWAVQPIVRPLPTPHCDPGSGTLYGNAPGRSGCIRGAVPDARPRKCPVRGGYTGQVPSDVSAGSSRQGSYSGTESPWAHRLLELAAPRRQTVLLCATIAAQNQCSRTAPNGGYSRAQVLFQHDRRCLPYRAGAA
jgi:hypothetical protein